MLKEQILFNLLFNSICSFYAGMVVAWLSIQIFRIKDSRLKYFVLSLPFLKIYWDLFHGIPAGSLVHAKISPFSLPPKHQTLSISAGMSDFGPILRLIFSARDATGHEYSLSVADYFYFWV